MYFPRQCNGRQAKTVRANKIFHFNANFKCMSVQIYIQICMWHLDLLWYAMCIQFQCIRCRVHSIIWTCVEYCDFTPAITNYKFSNQYVQQSYFMQIISIAGCSRSCPLILFRERCVVGVVFMVLSELDGCLCDDAMAIIKVNTT